MFIPPAILPVGDIPFIGKWISRIQRVKDILGTPCNVGPAIWAEAAFAALPTLLIGTIGPSATDSAITRVGFGGGPAHGRGTKFHFHVLSIIQLAETELETMSWVKFELGALGAEFLWYFAIADATTDFLVNWTSLAYQWAGCQFPHSAWGSCSINGTVFWAPPITGPNFQEFNVHDASQMTAGASGIFVPAGLAPTVTWSADYDQSLLPPAFQGEGTISLVDLTAGTTLKSQHIGGGLGAKGQIREVFRGYLQGTGAHHYDLQWSGSGWVALTSASINAVSQNAHDGIVPAHVHYGK